MALLSFIFFFFVLALFIFLLSPFSYPPFRFSVFFLLFSISSLACPQDFLFPIPVFPDSRTLFLHDFDPTSPSSWPPLLPFSGPPLLSFPASTSPFLGLCPVVLQVSAAGSPGWRVHRLWAGCLPFLCPRVEAGSLEPTLTELPPPTLRPDPPNSFCWGPTAAAARQGVWQASPSRHSGEAHLPCPW